MKLFKRLTGIAGAAAMLTGALTFTSQNVIADESNTGIEKNAGAEAKSGLLEGVPEDAAKYTVSWPDGSAADYTSYAEVVKAAGEEKLLGTYTSDKNGEVTLVKYDKKGIVRVYESVIPEGYTADERSFSANLGKGSINIINKKAAAPASDTDKEDPTSAVRTGGANVKKASSAAAPGTGDTNHTPLWAGIAAGAAATAVIAVLIRKKKTGALMALISAGAIGAAGLAGYTRTEAAQDDVREAADFKILKTDEAGNALEGAVFEIYAMPSAVSWEEKKPAPEPEEPTRVDKLLASMTLDQKIAQMIMPAFRSWNGWGNNVKDLSQFPELAEALTRHQYGGVILFGQNIESTEQTTRLINDLQVNNAKSSDAKETGVIPYLVSADQEGGAVARLSMGTRGTGSMAIGATDENGKQNAYDIGKVFGEELSALGINVNLGPCIDIIEDMADLGLSTRVFSDDKDTVNELGLAYKEGIDESNVITTFKHFPGAGDGSDYPTSIHVSLDKLENGGLASYRSAVENGAEMIMTAATTFPMIDDTYTMADGVTKGYYPATMSYKIVTEMLREDLGFEGVVITDALEMEQFVVEPDNGEKYFTGDRATLEHDIPVAMHSINAGCDILLIPTDMNSPDMVEYYDGYIAGIESLVNEGKISAGRIDESVRRILELKERHGLLDLDTTGDDLESKISHAVKTVGSEAHHAVEEKTAKQAITLLKDDDAVPVTEDDKKIVIIGRTKLDDVPISYAINKLKDEGIIDSNTLTQNRISGTTTGDKSSGRLIIIDHYFESGTGLVYSDELSADVKSADKVVVLSSVSAGTDQLQDDYVPLQGVRRILDDAREGGAKSVLLSANIPVDTTRLSDADAVVCCYLSAGYGVDPTARTAGSENVGAFNANVPAAISAIFGASEMTGKLPINIPAMEKNAGGSYVYTDKILYERGYSVIDE